MSICRRCGRPHKGPDPERCEACQRAEDAEVAIAQATGQIDVQQAARDPELLQRVHEFARQVAHAPPYVLDRTPAQRRFFVVMLLEFIDLTQIVPMSFVEEHELQGMIVSAMEWGLAMGGQFREEMKGFGFDPET